MKLQAGHQVQYFPLSELKIKPNLAGRVPKSLNQQDTITLNSNGTFAHFAVLFFFFVLFFSPRIFHIIIHLAETFICQTLAVEL